MIKKILPISIVIPSIGEDFLLPNVLKLLSDDVYEFSEILIIIPESFKKKEHKNFKNVKFYFTDFSGQVKQRIEGFKKCEFDYVLQLDCDCKISPFSIFKMYEYLKFFKDKKDAIAPVYYDQLNNTPVHKYNDDFFNLIKSYLVSIICGAKNGIEKMGTLSKIGTNYGVDPNYMVNELVKSSWLAGGCILHHKTNLILENYYPFKGKAYGEDLIHSYLLTKNNINLWISKKSSCFCERPFLPLNIFEFKKFLDASRFFSKKLRKNNFYYKINFYIWYLISYLRVFVKK